MRPETRLAVGSGWLWYLAAATGCQAVFAFFYWLVLARLSTFGWNRAYLLSSLIFSLLLPLVALPAAWARLLWPAATAAAGALPAWQFGPAAPASSPAAAGPVVGFSGEALVLAAYWLGMMWQAGRTARSLGWLYRLSRRHPRTRLGRGWLVHLPEPSRPAFSFGKYVFLSPAHTQLPAAEYAQLLQHEQVHGAQYHSCDLLLAEVIGWFFWFNGLLLYLHHQLRTVHEYLADAAVARPPGSRAAYGRLLLKLASGPLPASLVHPFAAKQVALRIHMLTFPPSSPMKKLRFLFVIPVAAVAWLGAAALGPAPALAAGAPGPTAPRPTAQSQIGSITWQGNKFLTNDQLTEALGLRPGDPYDAQALKARLGQLAVAEGTDITSHYLNQGFLFFSINPVAKTRPDGTTDLTFIISEGRQSRVGTVTITGNQKVATADILRLVSLRSGDLFSRAQLLESQRKLAQSGEFNPTEIGINPQPVFRPSEATDMVNITFTVREK